MVQIPNNSDQELSGLVERAAKGEELAFGQLYDLYFAKIYRFVYYRVNHQETAEDLVADTFIRAWNGLSGIADGQAFNGWLYQIARNLVVDHYRSRKVTVDLVTLENVLEYEGNIVDETELSLAQKKFLEALEKLSPDQQITIKLRFLEDLSNREIAQILDKTEGAIRVIQHRAIKELKNLLNEHDPFQ